MVSPIHRLTGPRRYSLELALVALATLPLAAVAQDDVVAIGPPPHFMAAWSPSGTLIDISRTEALRAKVSLDLTDVPLGEALRAILKQVDIYLAYRVDVLPADRTVSLHARDITVASALAELLLDTGIDVTMSRGGAFALVECPHLRILAAARDSGTAMGRVVDRRTNTPLIGAMVTVEGTSLSAMTNGEGRYRIAGIGTGEYVLVAKSIGYSPTRDTVLVGARGVVHDFALGRSAQPLEQVVVTGTLVPTAIRALPTPITVITADDIRRQNVTKLSQLFRGQVASALAWDRPADDHYHIISVRGAPSFSSWAPKTFIDGIEVALPQFAALIDPNSIERIEFIRGPQASTLYGSDAVGGVLQIFTKKGEFGLERPTGNIRASATLVQKNDGPGVAAKFENSVTLQNGGEHSRYQATAYYRHDGEWTPSYSNTNWSVTMSGEQDHGPLTTRVTTIVARKSYDRYWFTALRDSGYVRYSQPPFLTIGLETETFGADFVYTPAPWWRHELVLGYDRWAFSLVQTRQRLTTPADTLLQTITNHRGKLSIFYHTTATAPLSRRANLALTAGFNYYQLDGSDGFAPTTTNTEGALDNPTLSRLPSANTGYFAQTQLYLGTSGSITAGLRAEKSPGFGKDVGTVVSPRIGGAYLRNLGPVAVKVRAAYGESIRSLEPVLNQPAVAVGYKQISNPSLRPERQHGYDSGIDLYWGSRTSLNITYYDQQALDLIAQVILDTAGGVQQTQQQNVGKIRNRGWEFEVRYQATRLAITGTLAITQSRIQQLDSLYGGNYRIGDRPLNVPRRTLGLTMAYSLSPNTSIHAGATSVSNWIDRDLIAFFGGLYGNVPRRPLDRDYWITYPGFTKFRAGIEHNLWKTVMGSFEVENLTNQQAFETHNLDVPSPRTFSLGLRIPF